MKRRDPLRHLRRQGCVVAREGSNHTILANSTARCSAGVPRHREISDYLVRKISRDLQVAQP